MMEENCLIISIVVPTRNNQEGLPVTLDLLQEVFEQIDDKLEIVIVVNGSTDHTAHVAEEYSQRSDAVIFVHSLPFGNKGKAVAHGFSHCTGDIWGFVDADIGEVETRKHVVCDIRAMINAIKSGDTDLVVCHRQSDCRVNKWRQLISRCFNRIVRMLYSLELRDTQCYLKFMRREVGENILKLSDFRGFAFDVEILSWAKWLDYSIAIYPITWDTRSEANLVKALRLILRPGISMLLDLFYIRIRSLLMRMRGVSSKN